MNSINIFLHFSGECEAAFFFYQTVFGGELTNLQRYREMPGGDKMNLVDQEKIIHTSLTLSPGVTLMGSDVLVTKAGLTIGNNYHVCIQAETKKEADRIFDKLSEEGRIEMPMNDTFWGDYFGMGQDKFGVFWMVNFSTNTKY